MRQLRMAPAADLRPFWDVFTDPWGTQWMIASVVILDDECMVELGDCGDEAEGVTVVWTGDASIPWPVHDPY